jgi:hypothetical protein
MADFSFSGRHNRSFEAVSSPDNTAFDLLCLFNFITNTYAFDLRLAQ